MIGRILALAIGLLSGLMTSQLPEFGQQYRAALAGAIVEVRRAVAVFDAKAQLNGLTRSEAIGRLEANPDPLVQAQGEAQRTLGTRLDQLQAQQRDFDEAGPFRRLLVLVREADPPLAYATYLNFEPAMPATQEGVISAGAGFLAGWALLLFMARTMRRLVPGGTRRRGTALRSA